MGIVLKRRDNAPIVKDVYGGVIDILMKDKDIEKAAMFMEECLQNIVDEKYGMDKLIITKSLRSGYKNPKQIAHKVLADRVGKRDPGSKPSVGDRVAYIYIVNPDKKALQGDRIETPEFIKEQNIKINYSFYITNQLMKPLQQVFALVLEKLPSFRKKRCDTITLRLWKRELSALRKEYPDPEIYKKKEDSLRNREVKAVLFDKYLRQTNNMRLGNQSITSFFNSCDM
jgi:DNA polymerase elongation subunit (family B)